MCDELVKRLRNRRICIQQLGTLNDYPLLGEAADAIEELSKKYLASEVDNTNLTGWLAEEHAKHLWIPMTERLPEEGEFVLVYGDLYPNKHDGGVIAVSKRVDWNYWQGFGRERDITHWMPLPQPPKEE